MWHILIQVNVITLSPLTNCCVKCDGAILAHPMTLKGMHELFCELQK